jgi:hypothetical protein
MQVRKQPEKGDLIVINNALGLRWAIFISKSGSRAYFFDLAWITSYAEDVYEKYQGTKTLLGYTSNSYHYIPDEVLDDKSVEELKRVRALLKKYKYI